MSAGTATNCDRFRLIPPGPTATTSLLEQIDTELGKAVASQKYRRGLAADAIICIAIVASWMLILAEI